LLAHLRRDDPKAKLAHWTFHDLRRTARSLMSRAGVRPDIAERVLGHAIPGVEGVYDRHSYDDEKEQALEALALLVERIVTQPGANVVPMQPRIKHVPA
jgi:integrase